MESEKNHGKKLHKLPTIEVNNTNEDLKSKSKKKKKKSKADKKQHAKKISEPKLTIVKKRLDYVLVYQKEDENDFKKGDEKDDFEERSRLRSRFQLTARENEGLEISERDMGEEMYVFIHCPFTRLCEQAQDVNLEMPLKGTAVYKKPTKSWLGKLQAKFVTDDEDDYISAPFCIQKRAVFKGIDEPDTFFSPALRSLLIHNILINIDVRDKDDTERDYKDSMKSKGLPFMLLKKVYTDAFILHEESPYELLEDDNTRELKRKLSREKGDFDQTTDPREALHRTWTRWWKFQPLWKIRGYFGEKIGFYFAWAGEMASLLWIPMILGLAIWGYGLFLSIKEYTTELEELERQKALLLKALMDNVTLYNMSRDIDRLANLTAQAQGDGSLLGNIADKGLEFLDVFQNSFDSAVTPYFALVICLWGTIFQECWKRKHSRLAYEWDVDTYHFAEPDRPEYYGTKERKDPVSELPDWYYPFHKQFLKFMASFSILVFMALLVIGSVLGVIIYRVILAAIFKNSSVEKVLLSTVMATLLNSISIMILGWVYEKIAYKLTDWENHRTQSKYDDALIIKLFAFQFVNSYASLFYIAFFRSLTLEGGILYLGEDFIDSCGSDNNCMALLSLQVFVLMIVKPFPKFLKDVIIPILKRLLKKCRRGRNKVGDVEDSKTESVDLIRKEAAKPKLGPFTLGEFTEKTIQYGFLMLFSCALPLAPLLAMTVLLVDIRVDAARMLWLNRRPIAFIAGGIGMWFNILDFLNFAGVVTNAFLIAFTARWSRDFSIGDKLWTVILFEHIVLSVKLVIASVIPDEPSDISLAKRRQRYQISQILDSAEPQGPLSNRSLGTPVRKLAPEFKAFNYADFGTAVGTVPSRKSLFSNGDGYDDNEDERGKQKRGNDNLAIGGGGSDDDGAGYKEQTIYDVPRLSYSPDGNTYLEQSTSKLPSSEPRKKKKKSKRQEPEELHPDVIPKPMYPPEAHYPATTGNINSQTNESLAMDDGYPADLYPHAPAGVYADQGQSLGYMVEDPAYPPPMSNDSRNNEFF